MGCAFSCLNASLVQCPCFSYSGTTHKYARKNLEDQPDLLEAPLQQVAVMSSHNSYIQTIQHMSLSTLDAIQECLQSGVRCIELDVYYNQEYGLYVAHGKEGNPDIITTTRLSLDSVFHYLNKNIFKNTRDPFFIVLEINVHYNAFACNLIAEMIEQYFKSVLFQENLHPNTPMLSLLNKVVFMSGRGAVENLASLIHTNWSVNFRNLSSANHAHRLIKNGQCIRIYPEGNIYHALSRNYDPLPYLQKGANFVAMNICMNDKHMQNYRKYFEKSSFIRIYE